MTLPINGAISLGPRLGCTFRKKWLTKPIWHTFSPDHGYLGMKDGGAGRGERKAVSLQRDGSQCCLATEILSPFSQLRITLISPLNSYIHFISKSC